MKTTFRINLGNDRDDFQVIPAGLTIPDKLLVLFQYDQAQVVGQATNVRLVEGEVEADLEWLEGKDMTAHLDSGFMDLVPEYHTEEYEVIRNDDDTIAKMVCKVARMCSIGIIIKPGEEDA